MAVRKIRIKWATSRFVLNQIDGIRVRIEVECVQEMDRYIFAYRNLPLDPTTGERVGVFSHVCSIADLAEYPISTPTPGFLPEWFRLDYVDVFLRSWVEAEAFIEDVRSDVRRLKETLDIADTITPMGKEDIGGRLVCVSSSSSQSSATAPGSSSSVSYAVYEMTRSGTIEQNVSVGVPWLPIGEGAGSPIGSSDSLSGSMPYSYSYVTLTPHTISQMLLIRGYNFTGIPADAELYGISAALSARWRGGDSSASSLSSVAPAGCDQGGGIAWSHEGGPQLIYFKLYHPDAGPRGDERSNNVRIYGPEWQTMLFGGPDDDWNADLTIADIRRGGFGVALVVGNFTEDPAYLVDVDGVDLTIRYGVPQ